MRRVHTLYLIPLFMFAACGDDDPVSYSAPVGINLKAKSGDVKNGVVVDEKSITTESGNPFGAFVKEAQARLGGADPGLVVVDQLTLSLGGKSTGVVGLEGVFSGEVAVLFVMSDTDNSFNVGTVQAPQGGGPVKISVSFDYGQMGPVDREKFLAGSFKVVLRGSAAVAFDHAGAEADLQLTFGFSAFE
ncbi:MAG: hypothetical protein JRH20_01220 [Deltaproteobacteria bacterium]|nr:hypothetical protein [Deltaproteobacteria bacterium]